MPLKFSNNAQCFCLNKTLEKMLAQRTKAYKLIGTIIPNDLPCYKWSYNNVSSVVQQRDKSP